MMQSGRREAGANDQTGDARSGHPAPPEVLPLEIEPQPDDDSCGPTCLHAVYRYWGDPVSLDRVIESCRSLSRHGAGRGTLAVMLGIHALGRGFNATLYTFNLKVFDPTWFDEQGCVPAETLAFKLAEQARSKSVEDPRFLIATENYLELLRLGGEIRFRDLTSRLITGFIREGSPVLIGLSATYLYRCAREYGPNDDYDDIRGEPSGHFVVLHGYDARTRRVTLADPLADNPGFESQRYVVSMSRLVPAIMLGVLTYDANLLVIRPRGGGDHSRASK